MPVYIKNNKAVTKDTRTKKAIKADNAKQRVMWDINPATRIKESDKGYDRNKLKARSRRETRDLDMAAGSISRSQERHGGFEY